MSGLLSHGTSLHSHEARAPERFAACPPQNAQAPTLLEGLNGDGYVGSARWDGVQSAIVGRINVSPKRLVEPGPSDAQLHALLELAAAAPDHGQLLPWRFVWVPQAQRPRLGEAFVQALLLRDPSATLEQIDAAREKALRAPVLLLAVACHGNGHAGIPAAEQWVSLGAAVQNMLVGACALGFGSGLTSGQAMDSAPLRALFGLQAHEAAVCFVNIGTVGQRKGSKRVRPDSAAFFSVLASV